MFSVRPTILIILLAAFTASGQSIDESNWCRAGNFAEEGSVFGVSTVTSAKVNFVDDGNKDCPSAKCVTKRYVVKGDRVVTSRTFKGFVCSWFISKNGKNSTVGWIDAGSLAGQPPANISLKRWLGGWSYGENSINFTENKLPQTLNVTGDAIWHGVGDNVHVGDLDGYASPKNGVLLLGESDADEFACKAKMTLIAEFLVVVDNNNCGGANVSFTGVYRKTGPAKLEGVSVRDH